MSYFIANKISISKDRKTFKCKGGDNNVTPRSNEWTYDIPISCLYNEINSGNIKLQDKSEKGCLVYNLIQQMNFNKELNGNWENELDYFHLYHYLKTPEELKETIAKYYSDESTFVKEHVIKKRAILNDYIKNYDLYKKTLDDFHEKFLHELNVLLDDMKNTNKEKYHLYNSKMDVYIYKVKKNSYSYVRNRNSVNLQEFGKHRAIFEIVHHFADVDLKMHLIK